LRENIAIINEQIKTHNLLAERINELPFLIRWFVSFAVDLNEYEVIELNEKLNLNRTFWTQSEYIPSSPEFKRQYESLPDWIKNVKQAKVVELAEGQVITDLTSFFRRTLLSDQSLPVIFLSNKPRKIQRPFKIITKEAGSRLAVTDDHVEKDGVSATSIKYQCKEYRSLKELFDSLNLIEPFKDLNKINNGTVTKMVKRFEALN
jgi:hypothetical protein